MLVEGWRFLALMLRSEEQYFLGMDLHLEARQGV
jgi:hypothetical protein